jgi:hypothetical protein
MQREGIRFVRKRGDFCIDASNKGSDFVVLMFVVRVFPSVVAVAVLVTVCFVFW